MIPVGSMAYQGACRCGAVQMKADGEPVMTMACHCTGCQKMTASAFALSSLYRKENFEVTAGEPIIGGLRGGTRHMFCPDCMSWLFTRPEGLDDFVNLRATMFENAHSFKPFIETYTKEMLPWARTDAPHSFERFPSPERFPELLAKFAEHAQATGG